MAFTWTTTTSPENFAARIAARATRAAMMSNNPPTATFIEGYLNPFKTAAASLGMEAIIAPVHDMLEVESLVTTQAREPNSGLDVIPDAFTISHRMAITSRLYSSTI